MQKFKSTLGNVSSTENSEIRNHINPKLELLGRNRIHVEHIRHNKYNLIKEHLSSRLLKNTSVAKLH